MGYLGTSKFIAKVVGVSAFMLVFLLSELKVWDIILGITELNIPYAIVVWLYINIFLVLLWGSYDIAKKTFK